MGRVSLDLMLAKLLPCIVLLTISSVEGCLFLTLLVDSLCFFKLDGLMTPRLALLLGCGIDYFLEL